MSQQQQHAPRNSVEHAVGKKSPHTALHVEQQVQASQKSVQSIVAGWLEKGGGPSLHEAPSSNHPGQHTPALTFEQERQASHLNTPNELRRGLGFKSQTHKTDKIVSRMISQSGGGGASGLSSTGNKEQAEEREYSRKEQRKAYRQRSLGPAHPHHIIPTLGIRAPRMMTGRAGSRP